LNDLKTQIYRNIHQIYSTIYIYFIYVTSLLSLLLKSQLFLNFCPFLLPFFPTFFPLVHSSYFSLIYLFSHSFYYTFYHYSLSLLLCFCFLPLGNNPFQGTGIHWFTHHPSPNTSFHIPCNIFSHSAHFYPEDGGSRLLQKICTCYQTTQHHISEGHNLITRHCKNLKSHKIWPLFLHGTCKHYCVNITEWLPLAPHLIPSRLKSPFAIYPFFNLTKAWVNLLYILSSLSVFVVLRTI
jgi:hypothetical protein